MPKGFCKELNSLLRKFWWGFSQDKKHNLSFLAWDNICKPKALGGLGIRNMETMNLSLLAKLGWKIIAEPSLLWVAALSRKYFRSGISFLNASFRLSASWL
jgi:hypothetical protein